MSIFDDWTPNEIAALERATRKLRAEQPEKPKEYYKPTLKGCHYDSKNERYNIFIYIDGHRLKAGKLERWDEGAALAMQYEAEQKYHEKTNKLK